MRARIVWTILAKELVEALRDRRTLVRLILVPVLLYPLFALGVSKLVGFETAAQAARASRVAVWGDLTPDLLDRIEPGDKLELLPWGGAPAEVRRGLEAGELSLPPHPPPDDGPDDEDVEPEKADQPPPPPWTEPENPVLAAARDAVSRKEVDAVLVGWPDLAPELARGAKSAVTVYYDSVRADSAKARDRLERVLRRVRRGVVADRESSRGLPEGFATAFDILFRNVAPDSRRVGQILGSMMPMMLILMSLLGAFLPAIDLTAGEKERGTMQTLLCAPLRPIEIIWGKFIAVWCIAMLTALANVVSVAFTVRRLLPDVVHVAPSVFALTFGLLIPVSFLFSALFLALAVFAKDFKDGQNALMPAYLPLTLLAGITALPVIQLTPWTSFAPVLNIAVLIKALFLGEARVDLVFATLFSSALYAALALLLAARVFEREDILLGGHESARALLGLNRRDGGAPSVAFSLTGLAVIQVVFFYGSLLIDRRGLIVQLTVSQWGFFLLPAVALVLGFGFSARETFALRLPSARGALGALLVGVSAWAVVGGLLVRLLPVPESLSKDLSKSVLLGGAPLPVVLLIVAVTPAVCEELLFRGLVFSGLRRMGTVTAILLSAVLFGLAHGSVYRLLPTAGLGVALGYARHRTGSIAAGAIIHVVNNGLAVTLLYYDPPWLGDALHEGVPWSITAAGVAVLAVGVLLLRSTPAPAPAEPKD